MIDMEAADEHLRETEDRIETMRDPSHVRNLSIEEMRKLYSDNNLVIEKCEATEMPLRLEDWLELTKTAAPVKEVSLSVSCFQHIYKELTGFTPGRYRGEQR